MAITLKMMTAKQFEKQVRFAAAGALTNAAFEARRALSDSMTEAFRLRSKYSQNGLRVGKANRTDLVAEAGQLREYLVDQVEGGRRSRAAIPFARLRRRKGRLPRSQWPRKQVESGRAFIKRSKRGGRVVVRKVGKRRLRFQWAIPDTPQTVRPRWRYGDIAAKAAIPAVGKAFPARLAKALKTAR